MIKNRIKEIRKAKNLTANDVAELCNTTQAQISRLENGIRELDFQWTERISKALGVKPYELLSDKEWNPDYGLSIGNISNIGNSVISQHGDATIIKSGSEILKSEQGQQLTDYEKDVLEEFNKLDRKKQIALIYKLQNNEISWD